MGFHFKSIFNLRAIVCYFSICSRRNASRSENRIRYDLSKFSPFKPKRPFSTSLSGSSVGLTRKRSPKSRKRDEHFKRTEFQQLETFLIGSCTRPQRDQVCPFLAAGF